MRASTLLMTATLSVLPRFAHAQLVPLSNDPCEMMVEHWVKATNSGDAVDYLSLFSPEAVLVDPYGMHSNAANIKAALRLVHNLGLSITASIDGTRNVFNHEGLVCTGDYSGVYRSELRVQGVTLFVITKMNGDWKIIAMAISRKVTSDW
jgi:hypothetical protein